LGFYLWRLARELSGDLAGTIALAFYSFSPTVLAHTRLVTTDIAALFGVLFSTYFFLHYLEHESAGWQNKNFWLAAVSFGIALLTKFSTFLLAPYFILMALAWAWMNYHHFIRPAWNLALKSILIMVVGFVVIVGPIYQLHILNYPADQQKFDTTTILTNHPIPALANLIIWASDKPVLRSYAQYGLGLAMVFQRAEGGNRAAGQPGCFNRSGQAGRREEGRNQEGEAGELRRMQ